MGEIRLTCPECGAEYRVDDRAIPATGRDVECSSCSHVWHHPGAAAAPLAEAAADGAGPRLNRPLADSVLSVLREEADLARRQRAGEGAPSGPGAEPAPEPAADPAANPLPATDPAPADPLTARHIGARPQRPAPAALPHATPEAAAHRTTPRGLTLEPLHEAKPGTLDRKRYGAGFGLSAAIAAALLLIYVTAPAASLSGFRLAVDDGRIWLHQHVFGGPGE